MSLVARIDNYQRKHRRAGFPIAIVYKFVDDQGTYLAALITYYGVVSLFPLLLLLSTILNFVLEGDPHLQQEVLNSALGQFPVVSDQLADPNGVSGNGLGLVIGVVGTLYGGLGVAQALQNAMNTIWRVPRNRRPNPLKSRARSLLLLSIIGLSLVTTTAMSALSASADSFGANISGGVKYLLLAASVAINVGIFTMAFQVATARHLTARVVWPGALIAAFSWQVLQLFGTYVVGHTVKHASALNGVFGVILGVIAWLYLEALVVVIAAEYNVVRELRLYPRALLTPFTDNVDLTAADERAYTGQAKAAQAKGFETIAVTFEPPPPEPASEAD